MGASRAPPESSYARPPSSFAPLCDGWVGEAGSRETGSDEKADRGCDCTGHAKRQQRNFHFHQRCSWHFVHGSGGADTIARFSVLVHVQEEEIGGATHCNVREDYRRVNHRFKGGVAARQPHLRLKMPRHPLAGATLPLALRYRLPPTTGRHTDEDCSACPALNFGSRRSASRRCR